MKYYMHRAASFRTWDALESRTLLAGLDLSADEADDHHKHHKKNLFSKLAHKVEHKLFGDSDKKVITAEDIVHEPDSAEKLTHTWLKLLGAFPKEGGSLQGMIDHMAEADKAITEHLSAAIEKFHHLMDPNAKEGLLDVAQHLFKNPEAKALILKALDAIEKHEKLAPLVEKFRGLPHTAEALVDFLSQLTSGEGLLHNWIEHLELGLKSLQGMAVEASSTLANVLGQNADVMELLSHLIKHPSKAKDPETIAFVERLVETLETGTASIENYINLSPEEQKAHLESLDGLGGQILQHIETHGAEVGLVVENEATATPAPAPVESHEEPVVKKHKTKNPILKVAHFTEKKVIKPIKHKVLSAEHKLEKELLKIVHSAEAKAAKLKKHLEAFAKSEDKLKFIAHDIKKSISKIADTAKKLVHAIDLTKKDTRSNWEHRLVKVTHGLANATIKASHLVEKATHYHPKMAQYTQLLVMSFSKVMWIFGGAAGIAATAYPPAALIGLVVTIASKGVELTADLVPTMMLAVEKMGTMQAKLVDTAMNKVHKSAEHLDHHADKVYATYLAENHLDNGTLPLIAETAPLTGLMPIDTSATSPLVALETDDSGSFIGDAIDGVVSVVGGIVDKVDDVFTPEGFHGLNVAIDHVGSAIEWTEDKVQDLLEPLGNALEKAGQSGIAGAVKMAEAAVEKVDQVTDMVFPKVDHALDTLDEKLNGPQVQPAIAVA
jgi:hypothetical protein